MSVIYSGLKDAEESRKSKYSQALKKSSLEKAAPVNIASALKPPSSDHFVLIFLLGFLVVALCFSFVFTHKTPPKVVQVVKVVKMVKIIKVNAPVKHHHKKIKKPENADD